MSNAEQNKVELDAAKAYVNEVGYGGSVEALGLGNAFLFGALNQGSTEDVKLIQAFIAGMVWNKGESARRREVFEKLAAEVEKSAKPSAPTPADVRSFYQQK